MSQMWGVKDRNQGYARVFDNGMTGSISAEMGKITDGTDLKGTMRSLV